MKSELYMTSHVVQMELFASDYADYDRVLTQPVGFRRATP